MEQNNSLPPFQGLASPQVTNLSETLLLSTQEQHCSNVLVSTSLIGGLFFHLSKGAMTPGMPIFSPMMPYGSGLTPQPVTNTNSLSLLEEQQRQQQQQQASAQQAGVPGGLGQTPQLYHSQTVTTTTLPGNTPLYTATPLTPMTPITPATPASESSGIVPQLQ